MGRITIRNILAYAQGTGRDLLRRIIPDSLPKHIEEQFAYRCIKAKECLDLGKCKECGCSMPEKLLSDIECPRKGPEGPCYGPMLSPEGWEEFKKYLTKNELNG